MNPMRLWAIARKEFLHILRDPRSLAMAIAIPLLQLLLFGYALTLDVDHVPMVVWDQSQSRPSRELIARFDGSRYFSLRQQVESYGQMERAIDSGQVLVGLVIPRSFAGLIESGRPVSVQLIVDGSDSNTATLAIGYAEAVVQTHSQEMGIRILERMGSRPPPPPLDLRPRAWFNAEMQSRNFIIPGLIAVIMNVIAALLTSLTVAREWENGTMEQLISTPVKGPELILGKLTPYFAIGMFDVLLAVLMGKYLFQTPLRGDPALVFAVASLFLIGVLSVGMLLSVLTKSQLLSSQAAMIVSYMPALLLSGLMFAISNMPRPLQVISMLLPARHFVKALRSIYLKGLGFSFLVLEIVILLAFAALITALAHASFRKKLT
ncbi:MAG: ABC transporter permease [candidate division NC10 bacterium]|nr:ABC transporter permease [candidate division NC10 bacterium]